MRQLGRPLTSAELESYDAVDPEIARLVRVCKIPYIPGGFHGICLGRYIFLAIDVADDGDSSLLAHEMVHVRQWNERGVPGYLAWYLKSFGSNLVKTKRWMPAYREIDAEIEARQEATDWRRRMNERSY